LEELFSNNKYNRQMMERLRSFFFSGVKRGSRVNWRFDMIPSVTFSLLTLVAQFHLKKYRIFVHAGSYRESM